MYKILILYGTVSGNSEYCSYDLEKEIRKIKIDVLVKNMNSYEHNKLTNEHLVLIITSTYGDGDPPEDAQDFLEYLNNTRPNLKNVNFAVCALGDTMYPNFAKTGKDFDHIFEKLGATRIIKRTDCDANFQIQFDEFEKNILNYIKAHL